MYFAVLQGGAEPLGRSPARRWTHKALVEASGLPLALTLRGYAAALRRLGTVRIEGPEPPAPAVLCIWHHDLLVLLPHRGPSADWLTLPREPRLDPIARASEGLGFRVLRESFGEQGEPPTPLVELVSEGGRALLSVDGPREPGLIRPEPVRLALATGAPLVPIVVRARRGASLPGGMRIALPGGEIVVKYAEPITVRRENQEQATADLARGLRQD